jgi:hypothetical protein
MEGVLDSDDESAMVEFTIDVKAVATNYTDISWSFSLLVDLFD